MKGGGETTGGIDAIPEGGSKGTQVGLCLYESRDSGRVETTAHQDLSGQGAGELNSGGASAAAAKVANEKDTAAVFFCEVGEIVEEARSLMRAVTASGGEIGMQGIENKQPRAGSLKRVF